MDWTQVPTFTTDAATTTVWVTANRTTNVDIMCLCNNQRFGSDALTKSPIRASMPYKPAQSFNILPKGNTHFQKFRLDDGRKEQHVSLYNEMVDFLAKLYKERDYRKALENYSATKIQAIFRGFRRRFHVKQCKPRKLLPKTVIQLQDELCHWAAVLNLAPIKGLSVEHRSKTSRRHAKIQKAAAIRLQRFFDMLKCRKHARRYMSNVRIIRSSRAANNIIKFFKNLKRAVANAKTRNFASVSAAIVMQCCFRCFFARKR